MLPSLWLSNTVNIILFSSEIDVFACADEMEKFAASLGEDGTVEEYMRIAIFYEEKKDWAHAGLFRARSLARHSFSTNDFFLYYRKVLRCVWRLRSRYVVVLATSTLFIDLLFDKTCFVGRNMHR
jgi:hypothetical protein